MKKAQNHSIFFRFLSLLLLGAALLSIVNQHFVGQRHRIEGVVKPFYISYPRGKSLEVVCDKLIVDEEGLFFHQRPIRLTGRFQKEFLKEGDRVGIFVTDDFFTPPVLDFWPDRWLWATLFLIVGLALFMYDLVIRRASKN